MRLEQIDHVALRCASPEMTKAWYVGTLGFKHVFQGQWSGVPIFLRLGSTFIALFPNKAREYSQEARVLHLAFRAATYADFRSAQKELGSKGIPFEFQDHEISHSIYFSDPDGFQLEITTYDLPREAVADNEKPRQ
jgi:catechol 2,3-dioxygenase-like lactoylglutathione lyase family enzyme